MIQRLTHTTQRRHYPIKYQIAIGIVSVSIVLHALFAWHQPFTNDEGAYLYDARTVLNGALPAGDVLTKTPVPVVLFAAGEFLTGRSLYAARIVNIIASLATVAPLYVLIASLRNKRVAMIGAALWLLGSGSIVFYTMGHTQAIASFFAVSCLSLFVLGVSPKKIVPEYIFYAGICFALAYASRKTAIAVAVPALLALVVVRNPMDGVVQVLKFFSLGVLSFIVPWVLVIYMLYGPRGVWHGVGGGYADVMLHAGSIQPWAGTADRIFTEAIRIGFVYGLLLLGVCIAMVKGVSRAATVAYQAVIIGASWIASLAILYYFWPTHLVEYLADFIPGVVLAGTIAIAVLFRAGWWEYIFLFVLLCSNSWSFFSVYYHPWTGMFTRAAVTQSAAFLKEHVPADKPLFTAAVIVPYLSGHHVPFHLSHPQWYRYDFISSRDMDTFLPPYDEMETAFKDSGWVLRDHLTDYAYPGIPYNTLHEAYTVPNNTVFRSNPIRIYKKIEEEV